MIPFSSCRGRRCLHGTNHFFLAVDSTKPPSFLPPPQCRSLFLAFPIQRCNRFSALASYHNILRSSLPLSYKPLLYSNEESVVFDLELVAALTSVGG
jgi:hypothetical protein